MPDVNSIPFRKADSSGHYKSKQLPNDSAEFMVMLGLPPVSGDVSGPGASTTGQVAIFDDATGTRLNTTSITGLATLTTGVLGSTPRPTGDIVGTTDTQTLTNKTLLNPVITGLTGLTKADVGLGNVDNTSDATKNSAVATLTNKTIPNATITTPTGLVKSDVGLGNVDNTSDANKPVSTATATALSLKEDKSNKGIANGYASLDATAKVPTTQLPDSVIGASVYQGTWNAATNTPTIPAAAVGNKGWYYSVAVAGSTSINGVTPWAVGDQIISNGTVWQKIPNVDAVTSVNGQTGVVVVTKTDVGLSNVDNTSDANKPISTATSTALAGKEATANKGVASGYASLDGTGKVPAAQLPASAGGNVVGPASSVAAEIASYADTTGKLLARITPPAGALVGTTATQTLTGKTLTAPTINNAVMTTPTGITKADVGLANVDNTSDATKNAAAVTLTNKTINGANNTLTVRLANDVTGNLPVGNLNSGTGANSSSYWRGDGVWAPPAGGGDVVGPAGAADGDIAVYNGATGKIIKTTGKQISLLNGYVTGPASAVSGRVASYGDTTGKLIADGAKLAADLVTGPASATDVAVPVFSGTTGKILKQPTAAELAAAIGPTIWSVRQRSYNAVGNPNFEIDQINVGTLVANNTSLFACDRWYMSQSGTMRVSTQQIAGSVVAPGTSYNVSNNYMRLALTTQQASLGAGDYSTLGYTAEGCVARELYGNVSSVSLLVRSSVANLKFSVALTDYGATTAVNKLCTMGAANTWTLITLPNLPVWSGGTFSSSSGVGGYVLYIVLAAGSTYTGTSGAWTAGWKIGATGMDNFANSALNSTFDVAFVQHEPGAECSTLIDKPWIENHDQCCRYFQKSYLYGTALATVTGIGKVVGYGYASQHALIPVNFSVKMCKEPVISGYNPAAGSIGSIYESTVPAHHTIVTTHGPGPNGFGGFLISPGFSGGTKQPEFHWKAECTL